MKKRVPVTLGACLGYILVGVIPSLLVVASIASAQAKPNPDPSAGAVAIVIPFFLFFFGPLGALFGAALGYQKAFVGVINPLSAQSRLPLLTPNAPYLVALSGAKLQEFEAGIVPTPEEPAQVVVRAHLMDQVKLYEAARNRTLGYYLVVFVLTWFCWPLGILLLLWFAYHSLRAITLMRERVQQTIIRWNIDRSMVSLPLLLR